MGSKKQFKIIFRLVLLVAITAVALLCLNNHKVFAMVPNDTGIPGEVEYDAEQSCDATGNGIANPNWLSVTYAEEYPETQPYNQKNDTSYDATSVYIAANQPTTLFLNAADMYCNTGPQHYVYSDGVIWTGFQGTNNNPLYSTQTTEHTAVDLYNLYSTTPGVIPEAILGTSYPNPPHACAATSDPNGNSGCDLKGDTLEVSPTSTTWFSNIASIEFTIPAQAHGEMIDLEFSTIGINQFSNGQFICVNNPGTDHYDLYNFDGLYVPIGDPTETACIPHAQEFTVYVGYEVNISGNVYTYNPIDGKIGLGGTEVVFYDSSNNNYSQNVPTNSDGSYEINKIPLDDGFNLSLLGDPNNFYISPSGGGIYSSTCTGTPAPTNPPWCTTPTYNDYIGQVAGQPQIIPKGGLPQYNRGIDSGYNFVDASSRIITKAVDTSENNLPAGVRPVVKIKETGEPSSGNPYTFTSLLVPITGGTNSKYTMENDNPSLVDDSNTYKLLGSNWCDTSVSCSPTGGVGSSGENWLQYTSGTATRTLTIPTTDEPVVVYWDYELISTTTNFDITGFTTVNGTNDSISNPLIVTPGTTVTFHNYLTNLGPDTSTAISYQVYEDATEVKNSNVAQIAPTDSPNVYSETYDTTGQPNGTEYCEFIEWEPANSDPTSSGSGNLVCAEVESSPSPNNFDITGFTTVNGTNDSISNPLIVTPGTTVTFHNYLTNLGPDTSTAISYQVYEDATEVKNSNVAQIAPTDSPNVYSETYDTTGQPNGTEYCEFIEWEPANSDPTSSGSGNLVCAEVESSPSPNNFDITGFTTVNGTNDSISNPLIVTPGTTVTFHNYLTNLGPDTSTAISYQVYEDATEVKNSSVPQGLTPPNSANVYSETYDTTGQPNGTEYCEFIEWEPANSDPTSSGSGNLVCAEVESSPSPNNFDITGFTTVNGTNDSISNPLIVTPGTTVTFHNYLTNLGPDTSTAISYQVYEDATEVKNSNVAQIAPTDSPNVYSETYDTTGQPNGTEYCEFIEWQPVNATDPTSSGSGNLVCAEVEAGGATAFDITGYTTVSSPTVPAGGSVVFHNWLTNIGPNRSPLIKYDVYRNLIDIDHSTVTLNPSQMGNVFSETFHVPIGTPAGTQYCEFISFTPVVDTTDVGNSTKACTTVQASALNCPTFPNFTNVSVSLPDNSLGLSAPAPSSDTNTPNARQVEIIPEGNYEVKSVNDISNGGDHSIVPKISPTIGTKEPDSTPATLDYTPYVQSYPYDDNLPSVTYVNFYYQVIWTSGSSPLFYSCNSGDTLSGSTCIHTTTTSTPALYDAGDHMWYCNAGTLVGRTCVVTTTTRYPATPWYAWSGGPQTEQTISSTVDGTPMPACYNRTFSLNGTDGNSNPTNSVSIDSTEDPTLVTVSGIVQANFDVPDPGQGIGLRQPTQVDGINTTLEVQVYHQNSDGSVTGPQSYYNESFPNLYPNYVGSSLSYQSDMDAAIPWSVPVKLPPLQYGDEVCINLTTNPSVGQVSPDTSWVPQDVSQQLANQQDASNPWPTSPQSVCTQYLAAAPYLKVFNGDVSAGTASDINNKHNCTDANAGIDTYNQDTSPYYAGAGTQLAAFAVNVINGFASAQNITSPDTLPPIGLTFANTSGAYGGSFGASPSDCSTDYYNQGVGSASTLYTDAGDILTSSFFANNPATIYSFSVDGGVIDTTNIPVGYNITLYSSGPITIAGNITYGGPLDPTDLSQMPNLEIVTDNEPINIDHNVTQLTGIYVAEGSSGIIDDCADVPNTGDWYPSTDGSPSCGQQLIVQGSFTANALYLYRTNGSIHEATPPSPAVIEVPCVFGTTPCNNAAEEFDYSPADWLTYPNQNTTPVVQSITSLPPVL